MKQRRMEKGYYKFMKQYDRHLTIEFKAEHGNKPKMRVRQLAAWNFNPWN